MSHAYKIKYDLKAEIGEFSAEEIREEGKGGTDAIMVVSLIYPEDGSFSMNWFSRDGRTGDHLDDAEVFKVWSLLASRLANSATLDPRKRAFAEATFASFKSVIMGL